MDVSAGIYCAYDLTADWKNELHLSAGPSLSQTPQKPGSCLPAWQIDDWEISSSGKAFKPLHALRLSITAAAACDPKAWLRLLRPAMAKPYAHPLWLHPENGILMTHALA